MTNEPPKINIFVDFKILEIYFDNNLIIVFFEHSFFYELVVCR